MKLFHPAGSKASQIIYAVLLCLTGLLILILIAGTVIGLVRQGSEPLIILGNQNQADIRRTSDGANRGNQYQADDIRIFTELGRLRITLANSSILILSVVFPYSASDIAFSEELAARVIDFRILATDYFQSLPAQALIQIDEDAAKKEILRIFNSALRLGRIETIFFEDLLVLDSAF